MPRTLPLSGAQPSLSEFVWFWWADPRLSATASSLICDPANRKLVSPATAWEIAIKVSLKKLDIGGR